LSRESSKTKPFSKKHNSNNKSPPHLKPNNEVKVRAKKSQNHHRKKHQSKDETLNKNIKTITTNNKRWDVLASPFYHFVYGKSPFLMGKLTINGHFQ